MRQPIPLYRSLDKRLVLAHAVFFSSFFVLYNPFVFLTTELRFSLFAGMLLAGAALSLQLGAKRNDNTAWTILAFVVLYGIAVLRMSDTQHEKYGETIVVFYQWAALSAISFIASIVFARVLNVHLMQRTILAVAVPCGVWICINFVDLTSFDLRTTYQLGNLTYDAYQMVSVVLGLAALTALRGIDVTKPWGVMSILCISVYGLFGFFILNGLARGEAIGFIAASAFYLAPRLTVFLLPFSYVLVKAFIFAIETPFTQRMQILLEGDYGARDELLRQSLRMLGDEPSLILIGGGMNTFQNYWSLPSGLYPHNILVESLLTGGIPMLALFMVLYLVPVVRTAIGATLSSMHADERYCMALSMFLLIVALKSGSLLLLWPISTFTCIFSWRRRAERRLPNYVQGNHYLRG